MKEQTGSRKKLLVPVVVLMLCLVTLTGAAYAYSSSMTYVDEKVTADSLSVDLGVGGVVDETATTSKAVTFTDNFVYTAPDAKTNEVVCTVTTKTVFTYNLTISGDASSNVFKVSSSNIVAYLGTAVGNGNAISDLLKVSVKVTPAGGSATTQDLTSATALEFAINKGSSALDVTVEIIVDNLTDPAAATKETVVQTAQAPGSAGYKDAAAFATAFNNAKFALKFEAVGPTA